MMILMLVMMNSMMIRFEDSTDVDDDDDVEDDDDVRSVAIEVSVGCPVAQSHHRRRGLVIQSVRLP